MFGEVGAGSVADVDRRFPLAKLQAPMYSMHPPANLFPRPLLSLPPNQAAPLSNLPSPCILSEAQGDPMSDAAEESAGQQAIRVSAAAAELLWTEEATDDKQEKDITSLRSAEGSDAEEELAKQELTKQEDDTAPLLNAEGSRSVAELSKLEEEGAKQEEDITPLLSKEGIAVAAEEGAKQKDSATTLLLSASGTGAEEEGAKREDITSLLPARGTAAEEEHIKRQVDITPLLYTAAAEEEGAKQEEDITPLLSAAGTAVEEEQGAEQEDVRVAPLLSTHEDEGAKQKDNAVPLLSAEGSDAEEGAKQADDTMPLLNAKGFDAEEQGDKQDDNAVPLLGEEGTAEEEEEGAKQDDSASLLSAEGTVGEEDEDGNKQEGATTPVLSTAAAEKVSAKHQRDTVPLLSGDGTAEGAAAKQEGDTAPLPSAEGTAAEEDEQGAKDDEEEITPLLSARAEGTHAAAKEEGAEQEDDITPLLGAGRSTAVEELAEQQEEITPLLSAAGTAAEEGAEREDNDAPLLNTAAEEGAKQEEEITPEPSEVGSAEEEVANQQGDITHLLIAEGIAAAAEEGVASLWQYVSNWGGGIDAAPFSDADDDTAVQTASASAFIRLVDSASPAANVTPQLSPKSHSYPSSHLSPNSHTYSASELSPNSHTYSASELSPNSHPCIPSELSPNSQPHPPMEIPPGVSAFQGDVCRQLATAAGGSSPTGEEVLRDCVKLRTLASVVIGAGMSDELVYTVLQLMSMGTMPLMRRFVVARPLPAQLRPLLEQVLRLAVLYSPDLDVLYLTGAGPAAISSNFGSVLTQLLLAKKRPLSLVCMHTPAPSALSAAPVQGGPQPHHTRPQAPLYVKEVRFTLHAGFSGGDAAMALALLQSELDAPGGGYEGSSNAPYRTTAPCPLDLHINVTVTGAHDDTATVLVLQLAKLALTNRNGLPIHSLHLHLLGPYMLPPEASQQLCNLLWLHGHTLQRLTLHHAVHSSEACMYHLATALYRCPQLTSLQLSWSSDVRLPVEPALHLCRSIKGMWQLQWLVLKHLVMETSAWLCNTCHLGGALTNKPRLHTLHLQHVCHVAIAQPDGTHAVPPPPPYLGIDQLLRSIAGLPQLTDLSLAHCDTGVCPISDEAAYRSYRLPRTLRRLDLSGNLLTVGHPLLAALRNAPALKTLTLDCTPARIDFEHSLGPAPLDLALPVKELKAALSPRTSLTTLSLTGLVGQCTHLQLAWLLLHVLPCLPNLRTLRLPSNGLNDHLLLLLLHVLRDTAVLPRLRHLDLSCNCFSEEARRSVPALWGLRVQF